MEGVTGENLDCHAAVDAGESADGTPHSMGVPGATWLATMALEMTRLGATWEKEPLATLWRYNTPLYRSFMLWPLWEEPRSHAAVQSLLDLPYQFAHDLLGDEPVVYETQEGNGQYPRTDPSLTALHLRAGCGITGFAAARRNPSRHDPGPLVPHPVYYQATPLSVPDHVNSL
ncbi:hypothetical protein [Streptomyces sp. MNP-20]|uniref:type I-G CRISPR-associated protein, Cas3-extension family n=1 Tax=Streptomyces sp. MNP-20 TaxID=2721165 RepID=UPI001551FCDE|nr:hypothetical protein [Streptomyces sp. MNP-20]